VSDGARVALTFDAEHPDRPHCPPGNAERILDALGEAGARATFFVQGRWAQSDPPIAERIATDGHLVGNHSKYHARMTLLTDDGIRTDVRECEQTIRDLTGIDPRPWFRLPFGDGHDDPRVLATIEGIGYHNVHWQVEALDWDAGQTPEHVERITLEGVAEQGDGAVVLLHTWPGSTGEALPRILKQLAEDGARFATLDELESLP
jgi:peptidoglycan/xylan/chitin deacetylase (PgdA/CDA1 family)